MTQDDVREKKIIGYLGLSHRPGKRYGPDSYLELKEVDVPTKYVPNGGVYFSVPGRAGVFYLGKHRKQAILGVNPVELKGSTRVRFNTKRGAWSGQLSTDARLGLKKISCWANQYVVLSAHGADSEVVAARVARMADLPCLERFRDTILANSQDFRPFWRSFSERARSLVLRGLTLNDPPIRWDECVPNSVPLPVDDEPAARRLFRAFVSTHPITPRKKLCEQASALGWPAGIYDLVDQSTRR